MNILLQSCDLLNSIDTFFCPFPCTNMSISYHNVLFRCTLFDVSGVFWLFFQANLIIIIILIDPVQPRVSVQKGCRKTFNNTIMQYQIQYVVIVLFNMELCYIYHVMSRRIDTNSQHINQITSHHYVLLRPFTENHIKVVTCRHDNTNTCNIKTTQMSNKHLNNTFFHQSQHLNNTLFHQSNKHLNITLFHQSNKHLNNILFH